MEFWIGLWTVVLVTSLTLFAGLAVVVTWRGFVDVRALLKDISARHDDTTGHG